MSCPQWNPSTLLEKTWGQRSLYFREAQMRCVTMCEKFTIFPILRRLWRGQGKCEKSGPGRGPTRNGAVLKVVDFGGRTTSRKGFYQGQLHVVYSLLLKFKFKAPFET